MKPFLSMIENGLKQMQDVMMELQDFQTLIKEQEDVDKILEEEGRNMI